MLESDFDKAIKRLKDALKNVGKKVASVRQSTSQSTNEEELSETAKDILNLIRQNPRITYDEIASSLGKARSGIARHLNSMQKAGIIQPKNEYGQWIILIGSYVKDLYKSHVFYVKNVTFYYLCSTIKDIVVWL